MPSGEFKRYRSGNNWVTAAVLEEDTEVEVIGYGPTKVSAGTVLIVTSNPYRYDTHSQDTFFDTLEFEEMDVKTVHDVPKPNPLGEPDPDTDDDQLEPDAPAKDDDPYSLENGSGNDDVNGADHDDEG